MNNCIKCCRQRVFYAGFILVCMFVVAIVLRDNKGYAQTIMDNTRTGYIYTGDSRIRRLNLTIGMSKKKDNWVYCKSGMGYNWFVGDSLEKINDTMKEHTEIDQWVIVSAWGVNDLWNLDTYLNRYKKLLYGDWKKCKLYLVSVNPVNGRMVGRYNRIPSFNKRLKEFVRSNEKKAEGRIYYIDTNSKLIKDGFSTIDGLHYSEGTNCVIYNTIREELDITNAHIDYSSVDMNINAVRTITVKDINRKVRWKIEDKSIVKITNKSGKYNQIVTITANKAGTTKLTATSGQLNFTCDINVLDKKVLVAYYSYIGNSEMIAEYVSEYTGGTLVEIDPVEVYPLKEKKLMTYVKKELDTNARPLVSNSGYNLAEYSEVYIGYPVWYEHVPRPILSFLDKCNVNGAVIHTFCASESGNTGECVTELQAVYKDSLIKEGVNIQEDMVLASKAKAYIREWIEKVSIAK